jgi:putative membrane protein
VRAFAEDRNDKPARFYRILNEVPPLLMVFIVILVIVQPF